MSTSAQIPDGRIAHTWIKPLSPEQASTVELLIERYHGHDGEPFMRFEDEDYVTLVIPKAGLTRKSYGVVNEPKHSSAERLHQRSE